MVKQQIQEANETATFLALRAIFSTQKDPMDIAKEEHENDCENAEWEAENYINQIWGR